MKLDLVVAGLGGQGVLTFATVFVRAAVREGYDARFLTLSALAQVGAPIFAHVRVGVPAGPSPKVPKGKADLAVGLERLESIALAPFLAPTGRALLSQDAVLPYEARFQKGRYPASSDSEAAFGGREVLWIPAEALASRHGPSVLASAVMLGAVCGLTAFVDRDNLVICLREALPAMADAEVEAFFEGYRFVTGRED